MVKRFIKILQKLIIITTTTKGLYQIKLASL